MLENVIWGLSIRYLKVYNLPIIFVFNAGSVVSLPFKDEVDAILNIFLGGEGIAKGLYDILFGIISPSGRLCETFVNKYEDVPFHDEFTNKVNQYYKESIFVGYRYYDTNEVEVAFPFGYGLSYTKFDYSNFKVTTLSNSLNIEVDITNVGKMDGQEVVQIYVGKKSSKLIHPKKELKAFDKVMIKKGESKHVLLNIPFDDLKVFDITSNNWLLENTTYIIYLAKNVRDIISTYEVNISSKEEVKENQDVKNLYEDILKIDDETYAKAFNLSYVPEPVYSKNLFILDHMIWTHLSLL